MFAPGSLALARFIALLRLIDNIDAALTAHELVVAMTAAQGFQGIADFHQTNPTELVNDRPFRPRELHCIWLISTQGSTAKPVIFGAFGSFMAGETGLIDLNSARMVSGGEVFAQRSSQACRVRASTPGTDLLDNQASKLHAA
jgi:hypothetical protein